MLKLKDTPRFARDDLVMTHAKHEQVGQHRDAHGFFTAILVPTDLVLAQAQARFQLPVHQLDCPTLLVDAHDLARRQLGQIGHQDFCLFGAQVAPSFAQYHSDFPDMTQTQARLKRPKGLRGCLKSFRGLSKSTYLQSGTLDSQEFHGLELR
jgi:hypothetical protein